MRVPFCGFLRAVFGTRVALDAHGRRLRRAAAGPFSRVVPRPPHASRGPLHAARVRASSSRAACRASRPGIAGCRAGIAARRPGPGSRRSLPADRCRPIPDRGPLPAVLAPGRVPRSAILYVCSFLRVYASHEFQLFRGPRCAHGEIPKKGRSAPLRCAIAAATRGPLFLYFSSNCRTP